MVETEHAGIHHVAGADWVSMYDFALAVAREFGLDTSLVVPASDSTDDRLGLDSARTTAVLGIPHRGLAEGLAAMRDTSPDQPD